MTKSKHVQKTGDNSLAVSAGRDINYGVNEEIVKQLLDTKAAEILAQTATAQAVAMDRVNTLTQLILPFLSQASTSKILEDPDYMFNITDAQQAAARSSTEEDLRLLSDLLERRSQYPSPSQRHKMATRRAIQVVGQVSPEDLDTLTILWYGTKMHPNANEPLAHRTATAKRFAPFLSNGLQSNNEWLIELGILDCLHVNNGGLQHLKSFPEIYADITAPGFFCLGMEKDEAEIAKGKLDLIEKGLSKLIIEHPMSSDRYCLRVSNRTQIDKMLGQIEKLASRKELAAFNEVIEQNRFDQKLPNYIEISKKFLAEDPALKSLCEWWADAKLPSLDVTSIGTVLAYSHFHKTLPEMTGPSLIDILS
jgi:hypothetical protein